MRKALTFSSFLAFLVFSSVGCLSSGSSSSGVISCYSTSSGIQCLKSAPTDGVDVDGDGTVDPLFCADSDDDAAEAAGQEGTGSDEADDDSDDDGIADEVDTDDDNDGVPDEADADDDNDEIDDAIDCDVVDTEGQADEARKNPVDSDG